MINKKIPTFILFIILGVLVSIVFLIYQLTAGQKARSNYWQVEKQGHNRSLNTVFQNGIVKDLLGIPRFKGMINIDYSLEISPKLYQSEIEYLISQTFDYHFFSEVNQNTVNHFLKEVDNFIKYKSIDSIEIHLKILPHYLTSLNQRDISSSFLHRSNFMGNLNTINKNFSENVYSTYLPSNGETYQLKGGILSFLFQRSSSPLLNIRGIYRINEKSDLEISIDGKKIKNHLTHFRNISSHTFYVTVDFKNQVIKKDNLLSLKARSFTFTPGSILSRSHTFLPQQDKLLNLVDRTLIENYITGQLDLAGDFDSRKYHFSLKSIELQFDKLSHQLDLKSSVINLIDFKTSNSEDKKSLQNTILKKLQEDFFISIISQLKLDDFINYSIPDLNYE